jgi:hypothetical protein
MKPIILFAAVALTLTACMVPDDEQCASRGFTYGTDGFRMCMMQLEQNRRMAAMMPLCVNGKCF